MKNLRRYYAPLTEKKIKSRAKLYWSILKTFLNDKKILCLSPLLHEKKFIKEFRRKAEILNTFFTKQCSLINPVSDFPANWTKKTHKAMPTIRFASDDDQKIIKYLDPNKAHGHDMISIRMVKLCDASFWNLWKALELIFESWLESGKFSLKWNKNNVVPGHRRDKKILINRYSISLLTVAGKISESNMNWIVICSNFLQK